MGITGLLKSVPEMKVSGVMSSFHGSVIGIDMYVWQHRGLRGYTKPKSLVQAAANEYTKQTGGRRSYSKSVTSLVNGISSVSSATLFFRVQQSLQSSVESGIYPDLTSAYLAGLKSGDKDVWSQCCSEEMSDPCLSPLYLVVKEKFVEKLKHQKIYSHTHLDSYSGYKDAMMFVFRNLTSLLNCGIVPLLVFDGQSLPAKFKTNSKRRDNRKNYIQDSIEEMNIIPLKDGAYDVHVLASDISFQKGLYVDSLYAMLVYQYACNILQVPCIVSLFEADACLARLYKNDSIDAVISVDSDLLMLGVGRLITDWNSNTGEIEMYDHAQQHETKLQKPFCMKNQNNYVNIYHTHVNTYGYGMHRQYVLHKTNLSNDPKVRHPHEIGMLSDTVLLETQISKTFSLLRDNHILQHYTQEYTHSILPDTADIQHLADTVVQHVQSSKYTSQPLEPMDTRPKMQYEYKYQTLLQQAQQCTNQTNVDLFPILFPHTQHSTIYHTSPLLLLFQYICLVSGCDYLSSMKGVGQITATQVLRTIGGLQYITSQLQQRSKDLQAYQWLQTGVCSTQSIDVLPNCSNVMKQRLHFSQLPSLGGYIMYAVDAASMLHLSELIHEEQNQRNIAKEMKKKQKKGGTFLANTDENDNNEDDDGDDQEVDPRNHSMTVKYANTLDTHIQRSLHIRSTFDHHVSPLVVASMDEDQKDQTIVNISKDYMPLKMPYILETAHTVSTNNNNNNNTNDTDTYVDALLRSMLTIHHQLTSSTEYESGKPVSTHDLVVRATEMPHIYPYFHIPMSSSRALQTQWIIDKEQTISIQQEAIKPSLVSSSCLDQILDKTRYHSMKGTDTHTEEEVLSQLLRKYPICVNQTKTALTTFYIPNPCSGECSRCHVRDKKGVYLYASYLDQITCDTRIDNVLYNIYSHAYNMIYKEFPTHASVVERRDVLLLLATSTMLEKEEQQQMLCSPPCIPESSITIQEDTFLANIVPSLHVSQTPSHSSNNSTNSNNSNNSCNTSWLSKPKLIKITDIQEDHSDTEELDITTTIVNPSIPFFLQSTANNPSKRQRRVESDIVIQDDTSAATVGNLWGVTCNIEKPLQNTYNLDNLYAEYGDELFQPMKIGPFELRYEQTEVNTLEQPLLSRLVYPSSLFHTRNATIQLQSHVEYTHCYKTLQEIGIDVIACTLLHHEYNTNNKTNHILHYNTYLEMYSNKQRQLQASALYIPCCGIAGPAYLMAGISQGLVTSAYTSLSHYLHNRDIHTNSIITLQMHEPTPDMPILHKCMMFIEQHSKLKKGPFVSMEKSNKLDHNFTKFCQRTNIHTMPPYRHEGISQYDKLEDMYESHTYRNSSELYMNKTQGNITCSFFLPPEHISTKITELTKRPDWKNLYIGVQESTGKVFLHLKEVQEGSQKCDVVFPYTEFRHRLYISDARSINKDTGGIYCTSPRALIVLSAMYVEYACKADTDSIVKKVSESVELQKQQKVLSRKQLSMLLHTGAQDVMVDKPLEVLQRNTNKISTTSSTNNTGLYANIPQYEEIESAPNTVWEWDMFQSPTKPPVTPTATPVKSFFTKTTPSAPFTTPPVLRTSLSNNATSLYSRNKKPPTPQPVVSSPFAPMKVSIKPTPGSIFDQLSRRATPAKSSTQEPTPTKPPTKPTHNTHDIFSLTQTDETNSTPIEIIEILSSQEVQSNKKRPFIYCSVSSSTSSTQHTLFKPKKDR